MFLTSNYIAGALFFVTSIISGVVMGAVLMDYKSTE
jgi:hypothetical protein